MQLRSKIPIAAHVDHIEGLEVQQQFLCDGQRVGAHTAAVIVIADDSVTIDQTDRADARLPAGKAKAVGVFHAIVHQRPLDQPGLAVLGQYAAVSTESALLPGIHRKVDRVPTRVHGVFVPISVHEIVADPHHSEHGRTPFCAISIPSADSTGAP